MATHVRTRRFDWPLAAIALALTVAGLATLFSATYTGPRQDASLGVLGSGVASPLERQVAFLGVALAVAAIVAFLDFRHLRTLAYPLYAVGLVLLVAVLVPGIGDVRGGARRWIDLGPLAFQPSELMKVLVVLAVARHLADRSSSLPREGLRLLDLAAPLGLMAVPAALVLKEPDLGTALLILMIGMSAVLFVGIRTRTLVVLACAAIVAMPVAWRFGLKPYQRARVSAFLNPERDARGGGYHIIQSKIAVGSGGLTGKGFLQGTQGYLRFVPEHHTDFIFSVVAEEHGWVGSVGVLLGFFALFLRGLTVARRASDDFGAIMAVGLVAILFWHVLINVSMVSGALPVVGVPLPFFSKGGTFLVASWAIVGLLLSVSSRRGAY